MIQKLLIPALLLLLGQTMSAQGSLRGTVTDAETTRPLPDAAIIVVGTGKVAVSDNNGNFVIADANCSRCTLSVTRDGYMPVSVPVADDAMVPKPINVTMKRTTIEEKPSDIPTVTLDEAEAETEGAAEVANVLHASRDIFQNISGFGWSQFRFRERGYDFGLFETYINGVPFNDPESGGTFFGEFGGLNDVLRNRTSTVGLDPAEFAFSDVGGATFIDTRASVQRKQIRASYASSNRIYRNRLMLTANTGLMPGGWAVSASIGHRWAQEGYVPGTFFQSTSYFVSVDKKFGGKHALNLTVFGVPTKRGRSADSFQEMFDIAGTNYYNPLWGYQNGEKRNSQVSYNHQPVGILRYDWVPSTRTNVTAAVYAQGGKSGVTRLNFLNGRNPLPDFNRYLPSSLESPEQIALATEELRNNEYARQIDWAGLYEVNRNSFSEITNADGGTGTVSGKQATYIVENQRSDSRELGGNIVLNQTITPRLSLNGGAEFQYYTGRNFKVMDDLLGADYWVDWDFLGLFDGLTNPSARNSDLAVLNNTIRKGDVFGYNYDENIRKSKEWVQLQYSSGRWQFFAGAEVGQNQMWRTGKMQNGRFPTNSLGDSKKISLPTYGAKGGITWKANGRNYLYANGYYGTRAPTFRNSYLSPRTRDLVVPNLKVSTVQSVEGGYLLRAPNYKARVTGYFTKFLDETENIFASAWSVGRVLDEIDLGAIDLGDNSSGILDQPVFFGAAVLQGVDRQHAGIEAAIEAKPIPSWVFTAATSIGKYIYTSRPELFISLDGGNSSIIDGGTIYQKNYYVPRSPQKAATVSVKYEGKKFWFASLSLNYSDGIWYDFDRVRRSSRYVSGLTPEAPIWGTIIDQQKAPSAYTLDLFGGKSWRIRTKYFVNLNIGVNNILNNQNIITSARDSYRNAFRDDVTDPRFYTNELLYAPGLNYFASIAIRMQ